MARFLIASATGQPHGWPVQARVIPAATAALAVLVILLGVAQERHMFGERIFAMHGAANGNRELTVSLGGSRLRLSVESDGAKSASQADSGAPATDAAQSGTSSPNAADDSGPGTDAADGRNPAATDSDIPMHRLAPGTFTCEASGHCSLGTSRTWRGDIATNAALHAMLEAVAFKREVLFTTFDEGALVYRQMAINTFMSAEDLGFGHMFLLAETEQACHNLPAAFKRISCVWDTRPASDGKGVGGLFSTYSKRWETVARIARMRYNVMSVDSDTMFLHNPYVFLKSGALAQFNLLSQRDGSSFPNCGVMYWQNAHPSGVAVWAIVEHADRSIRQREDCDAMVAVYPSWQPGITWEQIVWQDIYKSVNVGAPVFALIDPKDAPEAWKQAMQPLLAQYADPPCAKAPTPPEWLKVIGQPELEVCGWVNLSVPRPPTDTWWMEHGSLLYPLQRGPKSQAWIQLIREASDMPYAELDQPWEPQPPPPLEAVGYFPHHIVTAWGMWGVWTFGAATTPQQVISHIVNKEAESADWKSYVFKGHNWWHWEVSEAYSGNAVGLPDPRLLMLAPGVQLLTDTEPGFRDEVAKLAALAEAMGRRLVVPPVPCDSPWVGLNPWRPGGSLETSWEESYDSSQVLQFRDRQRQGQIICFWQRCIYPSCTALLPAHIDAVAYLERNLTAEQAAPSAANTVWLQEWADHGGAEAGGGTASVPVTMEAAAATAAPMAAAPVVFLGALPQWQGDVPGLSQEHKDACRFLRDEYDFRADGRMQEERQKKVSETAAAAAATP